jgi:hypothetical protein
MIICSKLIIYNVALNKFLKNFLINLFIYILSKKYNNTFINTSTNIEKKN